VDRQFPYGLGGSPHALRFDYREFPLSFVSIAKDILQTTPDAIVVLVPLKKLYLFPALVLLYLPGWRFASDSKDRILAKYNIKTRKNIICSGRMQRRKRIDDLLKAFQLLNNSAFGLILVGTDSEGVLKGKHRENIYKLGPVYGDDVLDLLSASTVYCFPGSVGLSIVDAYYGGLPFVTEEGEETAEGMYLKHGVNGFVVPKGDVEQLADKLTLLLENDLPRAEFSRAAKAEITMNGHIDIMCNGFREALCFVR